MKDSHTKDTQKETPKLERQFATIKELSVQTGLCYRTIHRAVQEGKIRVVKMGGSLLVPRGEVERLLTRGF